HPTCLPPGTPFARQGRTTITRLQKGDLAGKNQKPLFFPLTSADSPLKFGLGLDRSIDRTCSLTNLNAGGSAVYCSDCAVACVHRNISAAGSSVSRFLPRTTLCHSVYAGKTRPVLRICLLFLRQLTRGAL